MSLSAIAGFPARGEGDNQPEKDQQRDYSNGVLRFHRAITANYPAKGKSWRSI